MVRLRRVLLASLLAGIAVPAWAGEAPEYRPADAWVDDPDRALPASTASDKLPWVLFDQQVKLGAGTRAHFVDRAYRVQSPEMLAQIGTINLVWHPDRDDMLVHRVQIIRDGAVIDLRAQGVRPTVLRRERQLENNSLDGTSSGAHIDDLADVPPYVAALPLTKPGSDLERLIPVKPTRPQMRVDMTFDQSAGSFLPPLFDLSVELRGPYAAQLALLKANASEEQLRDSVESFVGGLTGNGISFARAITVDAKAGTTVLRASGIGNMSWLRDESVPRLSIESAAADLNANADRARAAWRDIPVLMNMPFSIERKLTVKRPETRGSYRIEGDAAGTTTVGTAQFDWSAMLDGTSFRARETIFPIATELPARDLPAARAKIADLNKRAMFIRAFVHFRQGDFAAARADLDSALEQLPGLPMSLFMRGVVRLRTKDRAGGLADIADARMQAPRVDDEYAAVGIKPE